MNRMIGIEIYNELLKTFSKILFKEKNFISFAVFGSVARGEAKPNSDIDVLVIHKGRWKETYKKWREIKGSMRNSKRRKKLKEKGFSAYISPVFLSEEELKRNPLILLDIIDDGIILFDKKDTLKKSLSSLKKRLKEIGSKKVILPNGRWYWDLKPDWKIGERFKI